MIQGWHTYLLSELLTIKNGKDHKALAEGKYPVIGSGGIMRYVDSFLYNKPSILLPRKGTLDNIQFCDTPFWTVDTLYYTEVKDSLTHPYYLYWYLRMLDLSKLDSGTGVPSMTFESYYNIKVNLPPLSVQRKIGKLLSDIDRKIALNRRMNATLEAMARQLYDYWFLQFDFPDAHGKPYKSSGGKMTWNNKLKREIPEGWSVIPLHDGAEVQYGFPFSTELFVESEAGYPVVRIRDILDGTTSAFTTEVPDVKYQILKGDVIVGMDGNFHMNFWHVDTTFLNQRCVRLRAKNNSAISAMQIYFDINPYIKAKELNAKGSTVAHLSDKDIKCLYLIKPSDSQTFNPRPTFDAILSKMVSCRVQISTLTRLRTTLLPLLMNAQVEVTKAL